MKAVEIRVAARLQFRRTHVVIRQAITRAIADRRARSASRAHDRTINKLIRTFARAVQDWDASLPAKNREEDGHSGFKGAQGLKIAQEPISSETPIGEEEDSHLGDLSKTNRS